MPLEHLLKIMRDPRENMDRRMRAAIAAAPYCHRALKAVEFTGEGGGPLQVAHEITITFD